MMRAVVDTSILVSALIRPQGSVGVVLKRLRQGAFTLVFSMPLVQELVNVLVRPKIYEKYGLTVEDVEILLLLIQLRGELVYPRRKIEACRDPHDDKVLEAAVAGKVDAIVSGDEDLLQMKEFESIPIISASRFLEMI